MSEAEPQVAFLRGINVGGKKLVPMAALKKIFEKMGCREVRTVLASGNVRFTPKDGKLTAKVVEATLEKSLGFEVNVMLRNVSELAKIAKSDPFKGIRIGKQTRLYVTLLAQKPKRKPRLPYKTPDFPFTILKVTGGEVLSVLELSPKGGTLDAMAVLEEQFGKALTTRNWNTVTKLLAA
ncbi:MAG: DUF1697 domain-containing protein [Bacillota bacterium]